MKRILFLFTLLLGLSIPRAAAQAEDKVHSGVLLELGLMQNRIGYHQALPLGFVVGAHIGYDLYSNPTVFFDSNRSSRDGSSDFIYMLLPTASLELRWYHAREKSQDEINRGGFVALGTAMQSHTGGIIFHKPLQGRWDYRWAVKAGWGYQAVLSDVIYAKFEAGLVASLPLQRDTDKIFGFPYVDIGIGVKL